MRTFRTFVAAGAVTAMVLAAIGPAAAQGTLVDYAAQARATGVGLTLARYEEHLGVARTSATVVAGRADAIAYSTTWLGGPTEDREVTSRGPTVLDPDGDPCNDRVPAELQALIPRGAACSRVEATGDVPEALATAGITKVEPIELTAAELQSLFDALEQFGVVEILNDLAAGVEEGVLDDVRVEVGGIVEDARGACLAALAPFNEGLLLDGLLDDLENASPDAIGGMLASLAGLLALPDPCIDLGDVVGALLMLGNESMVVPIVGLSSIDGLLLLDLLETSAAAWSDGDVVSAVAEQGDVVSVEVVVPALERQLADLLTGALTPLVTGIEAALGAQPGELANLPTTDQLVETLLSSEGMDALTDGPLITIQIEPGEASVQGDVASLELEGEASAALVWLGGSLFSLPGLSTISERLDAAEGLIDNGVLDALESVPLEDVLRIELVEEQVEDAAVLDRDGLRAVSGFGSVRLLRGEQDYTLILTVEPSVAGVGLTVVDGGDGGPSLPRTDPPTAGTAAPGRLPDTGGGLILLGLLALGGMGLLRRR